MKKRSLLRLAFIVGTWMTGYPIFAWDEPTQVNGVYQLGSVNDVEWFADYIEAGNTTAKAVLTADIDYKGQSHTPIGQNDSHKFDGSFDGNHHVISNMVINLPDQDNVGFFGWVRGNAEIKNIIIDSNCSITGKNRVGGLIGTIKILADKNLTILNCVNKATVHATNGVAAGILGAGQNQDKNTACPFFKMHNCVNTGSIITDATSNFTVAFVGHNKSASGNAQVWCSYSIGTLNKIDGGNNLFRGSNRSVLNTYDLVNTASNMQSQSNIPSGGFKTADPLHSGELCYYLNHGIEMMDRKEVSLGEEFTQDLSDPKSIPMPNATGPKVYQVIEYNCDGSVRAVSYNNTAGSTSRDEHVFVPATGFCTVCGAINEEYVVKSEDGFYHLSTPAQVEWFSHMVRDKSHGAMNVKLDADIDFGGVADAHLPIGTNTHKYFGHFDGQGHRIKGMVLTTANDLKDRGNDGQGFFGSVRGGGVADDVTVTEVIIENLIIDESCSVAHNQNFAAGVVGRIQAVQNNSSFVIIRNCGNEANVTTTGKNAAGILGCVDATNVGLILHNLWNKGNITGQGGESAAICAWTGQRNVNGEVDVEGCWNIGEVTGIDGNHYNMIRRNTAIVPRNIVDLCIANGTKGGNQGTVSVHNTENPIESGELCYLLNGDQTNIVYTQTLGTDEMPVYGTTSLQVYQAGSVNCIGAAVGGLNYNNVSGETTVLPHEFNNDGICDVCHTYEVPTLENEYYQLDNYGKLKWFETQVNEGHPAYNAELLVDLDFYEKSTCRIGNGANSYRGTFKGNDHVISNFNIATSTESVQGFFGWITGGADISGIVFDNTCSISCVAKAGIIGGAHNGGTIHITRLGNEGSVTTQNERAAGIIGTNDGTACVLLIDQCYSTGTISGNSNCSQIAAYTGPNSKITNSWACSEITKGANNGRQFSDYAGDNHDAQYENCFTTYHETNTGLTYDTPMTDFGSGKVAYATGFGQNIGTDAYPGFFGPEVLFVGTAGYTTFYDSANDWKLNGDAQAYIGTLNGNYLHLSEIDDVPAGTAVIIGGTYYNKVSSTATANATGNSLLGSDGTVTGGSGIYALANKSKGVGFYPVSNSVTIPAGKVYLQVAGNAVKEFYPFGEEETSLNEELRVKSEEFATAMYDLSGRKVNSKFKDQNSKLKNGIYIQNSKKVLF